MFSIFWDDQPIPLAAAEKVVKEAAPPGARLVLSRLRPDCVQIAYRSPALSRAFYKGAVMLAALYSPGDQPLTEPSTTSASCPHLFRRWTANGLPLARGVADVRCDGCTARARGQNGCSGHGRHVPSPKAYPARWVRRSGRSRRSPASHDGYERLTNKAVTRPVVLQTPQPLALLRGHQFIVYVTGNAHLA